MSQNPSENYTNGEKGKLKNSELNERKIKSDQLLTYQTQ